MYKKVETTKEVVIKNQHEDGRIFLKKGNPIATLKDDKGGVYQILQDDRCYLFYVKENDGSYRMSNRIFPELLDLLKSLSFMNDSVEEEIVEQSHHDFLNLCIPLIEHIALKHHPHAKIIVDCNSAELVYGEKIIHHNIKID